MALKKSGSKAAASSPGNTSKNNEAGQKQLIVQAAQRWNVGADILWGVYGTESGFGRNLGPSSAGAQGPFQFMPATARRYHLSDPNDFSQAVFAAAHYLHDLGANTQVGSLNTIKALNAYNGNGLGSRESSYSISVKGYAATWQDPKDAHMHSGRGIIGAVTGGVHDVVGGVEALGSIAGTILNPAKWAELLANTFAWFLGRIWKAIFKYALLPPWHWTERATDYYIQHELGVEDKPEANPVIDNKALQTISFWALGFVLLFGSVEDQESRDPVTGQFVKRTRFGVGAAPHRSTLGRSITTGINTAKKTRIKKSAGGENTAEKPEPTVSEVKIKHVRTVATHRNRTVKVTTATGPWSNEKVGATEAP